MRSDLAVDGAADGRRLTGIVIVGVGTIGPMLAVESVLREDQGGHR